MSELSPMEDDTYYTVYGERLRGLAAKVEDLVSADPRRITVETSPIYEEPMLLSHGIVGHVGDKEANLLKNLARCHLEQALREVTDLQPASPQKEQMITYGRAVISFARFSPEIDLISHRIDGLTGTAGSLHEAKIDFLEDGINHFIRLNAAPDTIRATHECEMPTKRADANLAAINAALKNDVSGIVSQTLLIGFYEDAESFEEALVNLGTYMKNQGGYSEKAATKLVLSVREEMASEKAEADFIKQLGEEKRPDPDLIKKLEVTLGIA